jgi:hypothetical protein
LSGLESGFSSFSCGFRLLPVGTLLPARGFFCPAAVTLLVNTPLPAPGVVRLGAIGLLVGWLPVLGLLVRGLPRVACLRALLLPALAGLLLRTLILVSLGNAQDRHTAE